MEEKVLVHHEERFHVQRMLQLAHDVEQLIAGGVEMDGVALAAKHRRGRAEIAAHRAADRWDDRRCDVARLLANADAQAPRPESRNDLRMADGSVGLFAQEGAEPAHAFPLNGVVGARAL